MSVISAELRISLAAGFLITVFYLLITRSSVPGPSSLIGYGLGITGFLMILGAELLYTWRKAQRGPVQGKMRTWLQAHILLGLIGPYLVLLHSAWKLNGLAGTAMILVFLMVASGFLLSYIYPALPRNLEGTELSLPEIEAQIREAHTRLQAWSTSHPEAVTILGQRLQVLTSPPASSDAISVLGRVFLRWQHQQRVKQALNRLRSAGIEQAGELEHLLDRHYLLEAQTASLAAARKLLGQARTLHITIGVVLFTLVFVHIVMAVYYAELAY